MTVPYRKLTPESAEQWGVIGPTLLATCDPNTGITYTEEELELSVRGFSGIRSYYIHEGAEVCFPDQSKNILGNRGTGVRGLGSCVLLGVDCHLSISQPKGSEHFHVSTSIPGQKQAY